MKDRRTLTIRVGWVLATAVLGAGAYLLGLKVVEDRVGTPEEIAGEQAAGSDGGSEEASEVEKVTIVDKGAGVSVSIPESWTVFTDNSDEELPVDALSGPEGDQIVRDDPLHVRLIAGFSEDNLMSLRVKPLLEEIPPKEQLSVEELQVMQGYIDRYLLGPQVAVAEKNPTNVQGKLAWRYIYPYEDSQTGQEGIHIHYFIFDGAKVTSLVFQALPSDAMRELAPIFDEVLKTYESEPRRV